MPEILSFILVYPVSSQKNKEDKKTLLDDKLIPSILYNCNTWKLTDRQLKKVQNYINKIIKRIYIRHHWLDVSNHIHYEKAVWLQKMAIDKESLCKKLLFEHATDDQLERLELLDDVFTKFDKWGSKKSKINTRSGMLSLIKTDKTSWKEFIKFLVKE